MEVYRAVGHREAAHQKTFHSGSTKVVSASLLGGKRRRCGLEPPDSRPRGVMEKSSTAGFSARTTLRAKRVLAQCARIALVFAVVATVCACRGEAAAAQETPVA